MTCSNTGHAPSVEDKRDGFQKMVEWEGSTGKSYWDHQQLAECVSMNHTIVEGSSPSSRKVLSSYLERKGQNWVRLRSGGRPFDGGCNRGFWNQRPAEDQLHHSPAPYPPREWPPPIQSFLNRRPTQQPKLKSGNHSSSLWTRAKLWLSKRNLCLG